MSIVKEPCMGTHLLLLPYEDGFIVIPRQFLSANLEVETYDIKKSQGKAVKNVRKGEDFYF